MREHPKPGPAPLTCPAALGTGSAVPGPLTGRADEVPHPDELGSGLTVRLLDRHLALWGEVKGHLSNLSLIPTAQSGSKQLGVSLEGLSHAEPPLGWLPFTWAEARWVTFLKSSWAPVVICPKNSCSATQPLASCTCGQRAARMWADTAPWAKTGRAEPSAPGDDGHLETQAGSAPLTPHAELLPIPGATSGASQPNSPYYNHWSQGRGRRRAPWAPLRIRWVWVGSPQRLTRKPPPPYQSQGSSGGAIPLGPKLRSEASLTSNLWGVRWLASRSHLEGTPPTPATHP